MTRKYSSEYKNLQPYVVEDIRKVTNAAGTAGGDGTPGVTDHGRLTGLSDDDHPQYLTPVRGDARYLTATRTLTAGAGLTGGGDLSADRTFTVGAGLGITVNADDVALASTVAGDGLTYSSGVLAVGVSGLGLGVGADAVTLTSSSAPGAAASILASSAAGLLTLQNGAFVQAAQSSATFASGFAGSGWRADYGITTASRASMETDDLTVRGTMRVYELLIQQIRATNGSLLVTSSSKVVTVTTSANPLWTVNGSQLTFNGSNATLSFTLYVITTSTSAEDSGSKRTYHGFLIGDAIRAQQVEWNGGAFAGVIQSNLEVTSVANLYTYSAAYVSGNAPAVGYDFVRLGNTAYTTRQGVVYLTSDDSAAPFIDIVDGIQYHTDWNAAGKIKARLGKLSGISDVDFGGPLSGYGLYSTNVYLKGNIYATSGQFSGTVYASAGSFTGTVYASDGSFTGAVTATSGSFTGSLTSTSGTIGGWTLGATSLTAGSGATTVGLDSGGTNPAFYAGSATPASAPFRVTNAGALTATSATVSGSISATGGGVISGNWYVGYDGTYAGSMYFGSGGAARVGTSGLSLVQSSIDTSTTSVNIPTRGSAIRWLPDISEGYTHDNSKNYSGIIGYLNSAASNPTVDNIWTSFVGSTNTTGVTKYSARVMLQAGNHDGTTYRSVELHVIKDQGANAVGSIYCNAPYTNIDGMLGLYAKTANSLLNGMCHVYQSPSHNFVIAYYNGTTTKFRYFDLTTTAAPVWLYSTSAPA